jgi:hypothetical protein
MPDAFKDFSPSLTAPASNATPVTPSDSVDLPTSARSLYVGGGGNVTVIDVSGNQSTFMNVQPGSIIPLRVSKVLVTGTTATSILALW